jgi:hypothetical protein
LVVTGPLSQRKRAETRKLAASSVTALAALKTCTRAPPRPGPLTLARDWLAWSREFASMRSSVAVARRDK